jgi:hypothetical protein
MMDIDFEELKEHERITIEWFEQNVGEIYKPRMKLCMAIYIILMLSMVYSWVM